MTPSPALDAKQPSDVIVAPPPVCHASTTVHDEPPLPALSKLASRWAREHRLSQPLSDPNAPQGSARKTVAKLVRVVKKFATFVGPGFMIAVAYIDPGNYSTDIAAGADYRFSLLFVVLMSNVFAIVLQSLAIKLGTVTGKNLAESCRAYLPPKVNILLYALAELAIIATDVAEVIGTAIAINLLIPQIPLVAGCAISICDVLLLLIFYRPSSGMDKVRPFEIFVALLVIGVVVSITIELSMLKNTSVGEVFRGFVPSSDLIQASALYQACGILGATVMPHSLYLGSGVVQTRLFEYDLKHGNVSEEVDLDQIDGDKIAYQPSMSAIRSSMKYSIAEVAISLFTFALFVNASILVVAGSSLYQQDGTDDGLFAIHDLLSQTINPAAGTIFALALLLSGISAGIVCTIAGQMVSEGALRWTVAPWVRRLITRCISITPSIIIAGAVGRSGLSATLIASQVILSVCLPFVSAPLIYFTCRNKYMRVRINRVSVLVESAATATDAALEEKKDDEEVGQTPARDEEVVSFKNHIVLSVAAVLIWLIICLMNVANIVLLIVGV